MEHIPSFKRSLLKLAQSGTIAEMLGCRNGHRAQVAFHLEYVCHVHVTRRWITIHDYDIETMRHRTHGRWTHSAPYRTTRDHVVVERATGTIVSVTADADAPTGATPVPRYETGTIPTHDRWRSHHERLTQTLHPPGRFPHA